MFIYVLCYVCICLSQPEDTVLLVKSEFMRVSERKCYEDWPSIPLVELFHTLPKELCVRLYSSRWQMTLTRIVHNYYRLYKTSLFIVCGCSQMPVYFMFCVSFFKKQFYLKNEKYSIVVSLLSRIKYKHYMTWPPTNCNIISFNWFVFIHMWSMSSCEKCSQVQTSVMAFPPLPPMYMYFFLLSTQMVQYHSISTNNFGLYETWIWM